MTIHWSRLLCLLSTLITIWRSLTVSSTSLSLKSTSTRLTSSWKWTTLFPSVQSRQSTSSKRSLAIPRSMVLLRRKSKLRNSIKKPKARENKQSSVLLIPIARISLIWELVLSHPRPTSPSPFRYCKKWKSAKTLSTDCRFHPQFRHDTWTVSKGRLKSQSTCRARDGSVASPTTIGLSRSNSELLAKWCSSTLLLMISLYLVRTNWGLRQSWWWRNPKSQTRTSLSSTLHKTSTCQVMWLGALISAQLWCCLSFPSSAH